MASQEQLYCRCPVCGNVLALKEEDNKPGKIKLPRHRRLILPPWTECERSLVEAGEAEIFTWEQLRQRAQQELEEIISFYRLSINYRGREIK